MNCQRSTIRENTTLTNPIEKTKTITKQKLLWRVTWRLKIIRTTYIIFLLKSFKRTWGACQSSKLTNKMLTIKMTKNRSLSKLSNSTSIKPRVHLETNLLLMKGWCVKSSAIMTLRWFIMEIILFSTCVKKIGTNSKCTMSSTTLWNPFTVIIFKSVQNKKFDITSCFPQNSTKKQKRCAAELIVKIQIIMTRWNSILIHYMCFVSNIKSQKK